MANTTSGTPETGDCFQFLKFLGTNHISVYVGPERKQWVIHENVICSVSPFFDKAIHGSFAESESKEVNLPEDDPKVFEILVQRLYEGCLPHRLLAPYSVSSTGRRVWDNLFPRYYQFIDKLLLPKNFRIEALDSFVHAKLEAPTILLSMKSILTIMQGVLTFDPAHKVLLDFAAYEYRFSSVAWVQTNLKEWLPQCTEEQKLEFIESLRKVSMNDFERSLVGDERFRLRLGMGMDVPLKSVADMPRYQIGFLAKNEE